MALLKDNSEIATIADVEAGAGSSSWGGITGLLANQTDLTIALNAKSTIADITTAINTIKDGVPLNGDTLNKLNVKIVAIQTLLASNDINLDDVQELVDAIKNLQLSLSTILINDLTTGGITKALTAQQGVVLKGLIDAISATILTFETTTQLNARDVANRNRTNHSGTQGAITIDQDANNRFTTDAEKATWDAKQNALGFTPENIINKNGLNGYVGLNGFSISFRNLLNTFTSLIQNSNTAVRTYMFKNRSSTIADDIDIANIQSQINTTKLNIYNLNY